MPISNGIQYLPPGAMVQGPQTWPQGQYQGAPVWTPPQSPPPRPANQPQPMVARGKIDDPAAPTIRPVPIKKAAPASTQPVAMPSPDIIGVGSAKVDWNAAMERMRRIGTVGIQSGPMADGRYRVVLVLTTANNQTTRHIDAVAATEAEAVAAGLASAEQWAANGGR